MLGDFKVNAVHIRVVQRGAKKSMTYIQGLDKKFKYEEIVRIFKKELATGAGVTTHDKYGEVMHFQGDHRDKIRDLLVKHKYATPDQIQTHGF